MTPDEQVIKWIAGESIHNKERNECCPDFSCCEPTLLAALCERKEFKDALDTGNDYKKMEMLGIFLERLILLAGGDGDDIAHSKAVHIIK